MTHTPVRQRQPSFSLAERAADRELVRDPAPEHPAVRPGPYCVAILKFLSEGLSSAPVVATKAPFFAFQRQVSLTVVLLYFGGFWPSPQSDSPGLVSTVKVTTKASYCDPLS